MTGEPAGFLPFAAADVERSLPERFATIARAVPDRVAIRGEHETVTYGELWQKARRIAHRVRSRATPEEPIALDFDSPGETIAAMLGVLTAGGFYVPLDPAHPTARTSAILAESGARTLLTGASSGERGRRHAADGIEVVGVDDLEDADEVEMGMPSADFRAFVLYTSGSTGVPKGVLHSHRNVLHKTWEHTRALGVGPEDRIALLYSTSLSGSVRHVFSALLNGATLCPFAVARHGLDGLAAWLAREEITIYGSAATLFRHFARTLSGDRLYPKLRAIHVGSETVRREDVDLYRRHFSSGCAFVATYGSSELSPICRNRFDETSPLPPGPLAVGRPAEGVAVRLVGEDGGEVRDGETGEIVVESRHLFLGYWRRPDLDREVLMPGAEPGTRRFRTGDLGASRPDGSFVHLGRKDWQVKIRGQRVETAEVESALLDVPGIADAVVTACTRREGDAELVAYLVPAPGSAACISGIRERLNRELPPAFVPSTYVFLPGLPRNAASKVDHGSLPPPVYADRGAFVAPATETERRLVAIWSTVLESPAIGVTDDFLDLGGHSLLALRLVARILDAFTIALEPRVIFELPTIAAIATRLDDLRLAAEAACSPSGTAAGDREEGVL